MTTELPQTDEAARRDASALQRGVRPLLQGGLNNAELLAAWMLKLPRVEPSERDLSAFAVGVEVGFEHARNLERQDWSRVHHVLAKHGEHPGRTDDHLADVIDRAFQRIKEAGHGSYGPLMEAVEWLLEDGHMNQEHLARLRAAWEAA